MRRLDPARLFTVAWRLVPRMPRALAGALFDLVGIGAGVARTEGVKQLEKNLSRISGITDGKQIRRLARAGMRSYMRYYCEAFQLPGMSEAEIDARVRASGYEKYARKVADGATVVFALGHSGNWDLAGAWANRHIGTVVTVAEKLEPTELFEEFLNFRTSLGMVIVPFENGAFRRLIKESARPGIVPLLADRDLSLTGVDVDLHEQVGLAGQARVAPGPAALALARRATLAPVLIHYERLHGPRRRAARSRWGIHIDFLGEIEVPAAGTTRQKISAMTQAWFTNYARALSRVPQDWHMLQKVFIEDLDPERLAKARAAAEREDSEA